ncbi:hypothetical protein S2M10_10350 [Sphingomonas sp. S2M10]|uniref:glycine zipper 2TM domain-containing protein n=1 Tax=Sphingomonas sp. S2M10 TaxID=2705010 RepID=UPI001456965C|nr:glycine zipper 2TM domain-containing protein [Sphingomonas sp. S2M10]NLS26054.1 hypothetical protein [Sphingomonas sp. S2M10]
MRTLLLSLSAAALAIPAAVVLPSTQAEAKAVVGQDRHYRDRDDRRYRDDNRRYAYREWRGRDGRRYCRKPDGTTGTVIGAVGGALLGRTVDTSGDRTTGTLLGGVAGAVAGRAIEKGGNSCR